VGVFPLWAVAQVFPPECPKDGTLQIVEDPARWADQCFVALNGRLPDPAHVGETGTISRDIDLDGNPELLEVRGAGNASKQIYAFRKTDEGFRYLGEFDAHPSFVVVADAKGVPTIEYTHRFGVDSSELKRIQYVAGRFVEAQSPGL
jgi:hypothetical protein